MKTNIFYFLCFALVLGACSSDELPTMETPQGNLKQFIAAGEVDNNAVEATENAPRRTILASDKHQILWETGDQVSIFAIKNNATLSGNNLFTARETGNPTKLEGVIQDADKYVALHPYNASATYSGGKFQTILPYQQTAVDNNIDAQTNLAVGESSAADAHTRLYFKNAAALLRVNFKLGTGFTDKQIAKAYFITKQQATGATPQVAGDCTIALPVNSTDAPALTLTTNTHHYVELKKANGSVLTPSTDYYFMLAPQMLSNGFQVVFVATDGEVCIKNVSSSIGFRAGSIEEFSVTLTKFEKKLITNLPLIAIIEATNNITFNKLADGTLNIYDNLDLISNVKTVDYKPAASSLTTLKDIQYFTNLEAFGLASAPVLAGKANMTLNKRLAALSINKSKLTSVDVSGLTALKTLIANEGGLITSVNLDGTNNIETIDLSKNKLTALSVSHLASLKRLQLQNNAFTTIDVSQNTLLDWLIVYGNKLAQLDVTKNTELTVLQAQNNNFTTINLQNNKKLLTLYLQKTKISALDLSQNTQLATVDVGNTLLTSLSLTSQAKLQILLANDLSALQSIDITQCAVLQRLEIRNAKQLTNLDFTKNAKLSWLMMDGGLIENVDIMMLPDLMSKTNSQLYCGNHSQGKTVTLTLTSAQAKYYADYVANTKVAQTPNKNVTTIEK